MREAGGPVHPRRHGALGPGPHRLPAIVAVVDAVTAEGHRLHAARYLEGRCPPWMTLAERRTFAAEHLAAAAAHDREAFRAGERWARANPGWHLHAQPAGVREAARRSRRP